MILQIIIAILCGVFTGIFTGLTPGVHINLVSLILVASSPMLLQYMPAVALGVFIIAMAITHTFLDALPGIYLGAPDEAQALSVLPGHRMLLKGQGHNAVKLTVIGALFSLILALILFPVFVIIMNLTYPIIKDFTGYLLVIVIAYMILKERTTNKKLHALIIFLLSGALGIIVFNLHTLKQPLFPLLSGLFGFSILLTSLLQKTKIPKQDINTKLEIPKKNLAKATCAATGVGFIAAFLPGLGSSQAAIVATNIVGDIGDNGFLVLVGGISTANTLIAVCSAYAIQKARSGAIVAINQIIGTVDLQLMIIFMITALIAAGLATILALTISKVFCKLLEKINYYKVVLAIMIFVAAMSFYFDGIIGFTVLIVSTAVGIFASELGIGKNHLMGCLILPVIGYFLL